MNNTCEVILIKREKYKNGKIKRISKYKLGESAYWKVEYPAPEFISSGIFSPPVIYINTRPPTMNITIKGFINPKLIKSKCL